MYGRWVQSKYDERDKTGKRRHTIAKLLGIEKPVEMSADAAIAMLKAAFGGSVAEVGPSS